MATNSGALSPETEQAVERYVAEWMSENGVPGASVAVVEGSAPQAAALEGGAELSYAEGFGARDLDDDLPATPDTLYGIGSCTKSVVATAVLQCVERTELELSDAVSAYLPHLSDVPGDPITVESLLTHTSGMPSDGNLSALVTRLTDIGDANVPLTSDDDFRRHVQASSDERYTEEEHFFYYNTGFALLGKLVAELTGVDFERYVRKNVFKPLGMERSCFTAERFEAETDRMSAYYEEATEDGETEWREGSLGFAEPMYAPGGLASSVVETSRFLQALMNGGEFGDERILQADAVGAMTTPSITRYENVDGVEREYGYGLSVQSFLDDTLVGHGGMMGTTTAFIGYLADADVGVVIACNTAPAHHPTVAGHALLAILQGEEPEEVVPRLALERKADSLVGEYESYRDIQSATVEREGTTLSVEVEGRLGDQSLTLFPNSSNPDDLSYYTVSGDSRVPIEFLDTDGGVDMLLQRWRLHRQHE
ncbi:MAG: serine hydrolase [Halolamina sp.]